MPANSNMSLLLYNRLLSYLRFIKQSPDGEAPERITPADISAATGVGEAQIIRDFASVDEEGLPRSGRNLMELTSALESFLGHDNYTEAVLVGTGLLGRSLLFHENIKTYGLKIVAAFDTDPEVIGQTINGVKVLDSEKVSDMCARLGIHIGIITVPMSAAQDTLDMLVKGGVRAVWNFAPVTLMPPKKGIIIKNEDLAASLATLTRELADDIAEEKGGRNRL